MATTPTPGATSGNSHQFPTNPGDSSATKYNGGLTPDQIKKAAPGKLAHRNRIYLQVSATGSRTWKWAYRLDGRQCEIKLGVWPTMTIKAAEAAWAKALEYVERGEHPPQHRATAKAAHSVAAAEKAEQAAAEKAAPRVSDAVADWLSTKGAWSESYRAQIEGYLTKYAGPAAPFGSLLLGEVTPQDVAAMIEGIRDKDGAPIPAAARLVKQRLRAVFKRARAKGLCTGNPVDDTDISEIIPATKTRNAPPLPPTTLQHVLRAIRNYNGERATSIMLELLARTAVRSSELREASWDEFDLEAREWSIPGERMKMGEPHVVPLPAQAIALLTELQEINGKQGLLFPNANADEQGNAKPASRNTPKEALRRITGGDYSPHCFRSTFSTQCNDAELDWRHVEAALAHRLKGVAGSYNPGTYVESRHKLMAAWSDYLDALIAGDAVPLRKHLTK